MPDKQARQGLHGHEHSGSPGSNIVLGGSVRKLGIYEVTAHVRDHSSLQHGIYRSEGTPCKRQLCRDCGCRGMLVLCNKFLNVFNLCQYPSRTDVF